MMPRGMSVVRQDPDSFPQFKPPFAYRGARAASDGTIWLPAKIVSPAAADGWAVVTADGKVREIVHLAKGVDLLGFGKGAVYVSVNGGRLGRIPLK